jgi:GNAT superfamily N-acetyltransferase
MPLDVLSRIHTRRANLSEIDLLAAIDDDSAMLFVEAGLDVDFPADHEFLLHERRRWRDCLDAGTTLLAIDEQLGPAGFAMLGRLDGEAYIEQLSVRREAMRRGIGTMLLGAVSAMAAAAGERAIWLTTYGHLRWNRPFYARNGYVLLSEDDCGRELAHELEVQRRWLPHPQQRVAMRRSLCES